MGEVFCYFLGSFGKKFDLNTMLTPHTSNINPFHHSEMTTLCSQCANMKKSGIVFTAELRQLDVIYISAKVLTEALSPENSLICLHL